MDESSKIETWKRFLRVRYAAASATPDITGLRSLIDSLADGAAGDAVLINSSSFEGEQATGQIVLEPMVKLSAALDVLAEIDPANTPAETPNYAYARFSSGTGA